MGVPRDLAQAANWYRKAADQGVASAQFTLAEMYEKGRGLPQDLSQAALWYRKAADQYHSGAELRLGTMYATGIGVPQDHRFSAMLWERAAVRGVAEAQYNIGLSYANSVRGNLGVATNYVNAYKWLSLAASRASAAERPRYAQARDAVAKKMTATQTEEALKLAKEWTAMFYCPS